MDPVPRPLAKSVGDAFVEQYYARLQISPELLPKFYKDDSKIARPGPDGIMFAGSTLSDMIHDLNILSSGGFDSAVVTRVVSEDSLHGGVLVVVNGYFTFNERLARKFTQTFFLAPQETGHYVLNDMLVFVEISEAESSTPSAYNAITEDAAICVKNLPPDATISLLENAFKQFGDIRRGGSEVRKKEGFCYGFVEFKEEIAAQKAIEASPIMFDWRSAYVEKKRPDYTSYWENPFSGPGNTYRSVEMRETEAVKLWIWQHSMEVARGTKALDEQHDDTGNENNQETQAFEEADAAKRAIKASPVRIDGRKHTVSKKFDGPKVTEEDLRGRRTAIPSKQVWKRASERKTRST